MSVALTLSSTLTDVAVIDIAIESRSQSQPKANRMNAKPIELSVTNSAVNACEPKADAIETGYEFSGNEERRSRVGALSLDWMCHQINSFLVTQVWRRVSGTPQVTGVVPLVGGSRRLSLSISYANQSV